MHAAAQAYGRVARSGLTARQLEAEVLTQCAVDLEAAASGTRSSDDRLLAAVERNRQLWSILAMSLRDPGNPLPESMKESLTGLARFVFARTYRAAETLDRSLLPPLASINRHIAAGLLGQHREKSKGDSE
jgi:flagellar protein FlaF